MNMDTKAADQWAMDSVAQYHRVLTTNVKPQVVYAFNANTGVRPPHHTAVYRSDDGGKTWRATFYPDPRYTPFNVEHDYMTAGVRQFYQDMPTGTAIDPSNPDHVMQVDGGRCYITADGGKTWVAAHTHLTGAKDASSKEAAWLCNGLVVTTTWNYYIDPFQPQRHYICYTDIGFARSLDAGKSWKWWALEGRAPWTNTCYELAFDPTTPGKIWGAFSNVHDIPNANIISGRHGAAGPGRGMPEHGFRRHVEGGRPGTAQGAGAICGRGSQEPAGSRTLYASVFGHGVFKSADDGKTLAEGQPRSGFAREHAGLPAATPQRRQPLRAGHRRCDRAASLLPTAPAFTAPGTAPGRGNSSTGPSRFSGRRISRSIPRTAASSTSARPMPGTRNRAGCTAQPTAGPPGRCWPARALSISALTCIPNARGGST